MDRFFAYYRQAVRLFAILCIAYFCAYCLFGFFKKGGLSSFFQNIVAGEDQPPFQSHFFFNVKAERGEEREAETPATDYYF
ncbi:MAG: hypothetical protein J6M12_01145 [Clostridia bacterium]|nr:hypothetical protein [Clostridia bacterium]